MDQHYFEGISADLIYHHFSSVHGAEFLNVLPSGFGNKIVAEKCCDETNHSKKSISHGTTHSCHGNGEYLKKKSVKVSDKKLFVLFLSTDSYKLCASCRE